MATIRSPAAIQLANMFGRSSDGPLDRGIEDLAEEQVHEEGEQDLGFWKFLEIIGRPQRAVSGVIFDAIDGGSFDPMDRVGQALLGEESIGMRDVLDEMFSGEWSQVVMPDWMPMVGGEEVDLTKGLTGFLGDVFTDPLMYVAPFALQANLMRYGAKEAAIVGALRKTAPELAGAKALGKNIHKEVGKIRAATKYQSGLINHRMGVANARHIWDEVLANPEKFKPHLSEEMAGQVDELVSAAKKRGGTALEGYARPTAVQQYTDGQRKVMAMRLKIIGTNLGFKDFSLLPIVDKQLGIGLAKGAAKLTDHLTAKNKFAAHFFGKANEMFRYSTGNPELDGYIFKAANNKRIDSDRMAKIMNDAKSSFKGHHDDAFRSAVMDYVERPYELWGIRARKVPEKYQEAVDKLRIVGDEINQFDSLHGIKDIAQSIGGAGPISDAKIWGHFSRMGKAASAEKGKARTGYNQLKRQVDKSYKGYIEGGGSKSIAPADVKGAMLRDVVEASKDITSFLGDTRPIAGYIHRIPTREAKNIFAELAGHSLIKDTSIGQQFLRHTQARNMKNLSLDEANKLFREGGLPDDALNQIVAQVQKTIKETDDKGLRRLMNKLKKSSGDDLDLFVDDPIQAMHVRIMSSIEAVEKKDVLDGMIMAGARRIVPEAGQVRRGESQWLLSPRGMEAMHGKDWRKTIGPKEAAVYDAIISEKRMAGKEGLDALFLNSDHIADIVRQHGADLPVYGIDNHTSGLMEKFHKLHFNPKETGALLAGFDKFTNWWKMSSLAIFPGYHARNMMYDHLRRVMGGTANPMNDKASLEFSMAAGLRSMKGMSDDAVTTKLQNFSWTDKFGTSYTGNELHAAMKKYGVDVSFYDTEFARRMSTAPTSATKEIAKAAMIHPDSIPVKAAFGFGHQAELHQRLAHWLGKVKGGMGLEQAAMDTKALYFNYSELTTFEKNVMRRVLPFYSFSRKNLPLVAKTLIEKPGLYAQLGRVVDFMQSDEVKEIDQAKLPGYINEQFGVPTRINKETGNLEVSMLRSWMGMTDLMTVISSNPLRSSWRLAQGLLNPALKLPVEIGFNKNMYTGQELQKFPGEVTSFLGMDMPPTARHGLRNIRLLSEADRLFQGITRPKEDVSGAQAIWNAIGIAPKVRGYDLEKMEKGYKFKKAIRKSEIKRAIRWAKKSGDEEQQAYYEKLLKDATAKRRKRNT